MCDLKAIFALLIILPSAALAQNAPNDRPNACNDVHWTKKWQCETDRLQADENRRRAGVGEEEMKLACQRLSYGADPCTSRMKPEECFSFQENRAECILRGLWGRGAK
jgi:hypothetical protein